MTRADDENEVEEEEQKTGRFSVVHRGGTRVEVGDPVKLSDAKGAKSWMCAVKLVGPKKEGEPEDDDFTQTLLVRTGRGHTPEEAQRAAMAQLALLYGTPTQPPPPVLIMKKASEPPPVPPTKSIWSWLKGVFGGAKT